MTQELWTAVDAYIGDTLLDDDAVMDEAVRASDDAGLPSIQVSPAQGKFLYLLARIAGARRILEIGTLGGYSTIWLARALPREGLLVTMEIEPKHAEVARANIARAGMSNLVEVRVGNARELLPALEAEDGASFDLTFIDADKASIPEYFESAVRMSHQGSIIVVDNVVREGKVIDAGSDDPSVIGVRRFNEMMSSDSRVEATVLQTVGVKGHDGLALALVVSQGS